MLMFPCAIHEAAVDAGIKTPPGADKDFGDLEFDPNEFPHWHVYCNIQLGCPVTWGNHWENAKIVAAVPEDKLRTMTVKNFTALGFDP